MPKAPLPSFPSTLKSLGLFIGGAGSGALPVGLCFALLNTGVFLNWQKSHGAIRWGGETASRGDRSIGGIKVEEASRNMSDNKGGSKAMYHQNQEQQQQQSAAATTTTTTRQQSNAAAPRTTAPGSSHHHHQPPGTHQGGTRHQSTHLGVLLNEEDTWKLSSSAAHPSAASAGAGDEHSRTWSHRQHSAWCSLTARSCSHSAYFACSSHSCLSLLLSHLHWQ